MNTKNMLITINKLILITIFMLQGCSTSPSINDASEKMQLHLVNEDAGHLRNIKKTSEEQKKLAVLTNPMSILEIKSPSIDLQLLALKNSTPYILYDLLLYGRHKKTFNSHSERIEIEMTKKILESLRHGDVRFSVHLNRILSKTTSEKVQLLAIKENIKYSKAIKHPTIAVRNNPRVISYKRREQLAELRRTKEEAKYKKKEKLADAEYAKKPTQSYSCSYEICTQILIARSYPVDKYVTKCSTRHEYVNAKSAGEARRRISGRGVSCH